MYGLDSGRLLGVACCMFADVSGASASLLREDKVAKGYVFGSGGSGVAGWVVLILPLRKYSSYIWVISMNELMSFLLISYMSLDVL